MKLKLEVHQLDREEVYRDFARIPEQFRIGIEEGHLFRFSHCQRSAVLAVRGIQDETRPILKIDDVTRRKLGVDRDQTYEFEVERLNYLSQLIAPWNASDPFNRQTMRLAVIGLFLGSIGLVLGIFSMF
jgi:hypothetical protein